LLVCCGAANELDLALDVYRQMLNEGCSPNLVTFNTLIDVYGKTGNWEEAVRVLDTLEQQVRWACCACVLCCPVQACCVKATSCVLRCCHTGRLFIMYLQVVYYVFQVPLTMGCARAVLGSFRLPRQRWSKPPGRAGFPGSPACCSHPVPDFCAFMLQGIDPEIRTFNTVIIACNMSGQAQEALKIYERMLAAGAQPTATTYVLSFLLSFAMATPAFALSLFGRALRAYMPAFAPS
jgi:pentatricopeptide repeat protein